MVNRLGLRFGIAAVLAITITALAAGTASADPVVPKKHTSVSLDCGNGVLSMVVNGNGRWAPAFDANSTQVFIGLQFGPQTGVFTDPDGNQTPLFFPASPPKGSANPPGVTILNCGFTIDQTFDDGSNFFLQGTVTGFFE